MVRLCARVWARVIGARYVGSGAYAHDNGTGGVVRLLSKLPSPPDDWKVTLDLEATGNDTHWDWIVSESRLGKLLKEGP